MQTTQPASEIQLNPDSAADQPSPFQSECLTTALELRQLLLEEAKILKKFAAAELMWLIPRKEFLISELEWKLETAMKSEGVPASDTLRELLGDIERLNASNGLFIEKSICYWEELLSVLLPPSYGPSGEAKNPGASSRGLAFKREV